ncbi:hypothetical protein L1049_012761 [Liquidambar formosana]|uniref:Uncharacterized protein n=1 Tax=Liquidambar formosana TaxID=63359 RepID=A0AAP0WWG1_LIQFO
MANLVMLFSLLLLFNIFSLPLLSAAQSLIDTCKSTATLTCGDTSYSTYDCSPPITSPTQAKLSWNDFSEGGGGGASSECDDRYHNNTELVVALMRYPQDVVVDECDLLHGCDEERAGLPPCKNNFVDGSDAVSNGLGVDIELGEVDITWSSV